MLNDKNDSLIKFLQWKSDCWRNAAVLLFVAIKSEDKEIIEKAMNNFYKVKELHPFIDQQEFDEE